MWMHIGAIANFQTLRPLLLNRLGDPPLRHHRRLPCHVCWKFSLLCRVLVKPTTVYVRKASPSGMGPLSTEGEGQKSDFPPRASRVVLPYELRTFYFHSWVALILRLSGVRNVVQLV